MALRRIFTVLATPLADISICARNVFAGVFNACLALGALLIGYALNTLLVRRVTDAFLTLNTLTTLLTTKEHWVVLYGDAGVDERIAALEVFPTSVPVRTAVLIAIGRAEPTDLLAVVIVPNTDIALRAVGLSLTDATIPNGALSCLGNADLGALALDVCAAIDTLARDLVARCAISAVSRCTDPFDAVLALTIDAAGVTFNGAGLIDGAHATVLWVESKNLPE